MNTLKVKIIGCGGIGLCVLNVLPRYLAHQKDYANFDLTLVDGDSYEDKNSSRQSFARRGNKAEVTADTIRKQFPNLYCWVTSDYITDSNVGMIIQDGDVVFSCVDNHATRKLLSDYCESLENVVLISGGNDYKDGNIQVFIKKEGRNVTLPLASEFHPEIASPADKNPGEKARESSGCGEEIASSPQLIITNNFVAASMLNAFYGWTQGVFDGNQKYDEAYNDILLNAVRPCKRS
jgi:molybdopterin/thiamine biosynthesis adenylyltransferase